MRCPAPVALLVVAATTVAGLTGCSALGDDEDEVLDAPVGEVVPVTAAWDVEGRPTEVVVPGRRYGFVVSSPRDRIDSSTAFAAGLGEEVADGKAVVAVAWNLQAADGDWFAAVTEDAPSMPLTLLVDGEELPVGDLGGEVDAAYVVVPDDAEEIGIEVGYEGETQRIDDLADPLARRPRDGRPGLYTRTPQLLPYEEQQAARTDGAASLFGGEVTTRVLSPVPYATGLGWAPAGQAWVLADVSVRGQTAGVDTAGGYVSYEGRGADAVVRLDGAEPERLRPIGSPRADTETVGSEDPSATDADDTWTAQAVFLVPEDTYTGDLTVTRRLTIRPEDSDEARRLGAPADVDRTLRHERSLSF